MRVLKMCLLSRRRMPKLTKHNMKARQAFRFSGNILQLLSIDVAALPRWMREQSGSLHYWRPGVTVTNLSLNEETFSCSPSICTFADLAGHKNPPVITKHKLLLYHGWKWLEVTPACLTFQNRNSWTRSGPKCSSAQFNAKQVALPGFGFGLLSGPVDKRASMESKWCAGTSG